MSWWYRPHQYVFQWVKSELIVVIVMPSYYIQLQPQTCRIKSFVSVFCLHILPKIIIIDGGGDHDDDDDDNIGVVA